MTDSAKVRIFGYTAIMLMHISNIFYMEWYGKQSQSKDERVLVFKGLATRFFTNWTFIMQILYSFFSLVSDVIMLLNGNNKLPRFLRAFRDGFFASIVWPSSLVVFTVFWALFKYDRSLILPEFFDELLSTLSNHVIHTMIIPVILFEVIYRPRIEPKSHKRNLIVMTLYVAGYLSVLLYTYKDRNVWMYPIFGMIYGTIYFPLSLAGIYLLFWTFYYSQWYFNDFIHGLKDKKKRKENVNKKENKRSGKKNKH